VGGQRSQRRKWIHCFANVTAVLFTAAISEYDQVIAEDNQTNRVVEAVNLFGEICNSSWFKKTSMILFLNKSDILRQKLKRSISIARYLDDYKGDFTEETAVKYFKGKFMAMNRRPAKQVYVHITCATDTQNVQFVFAAVRDIVIRRAFESAGMEI